MSTIFIHPGMHKTGTSSIQQSLAALPEGRGPQLLTINGNTNMSTQARLAFSEPQTYARRKKVGVDEVLKRGPGFRAMLEETLAQSAQRDAVVSAEGLNVLTEAEFRDFIALVRHDRIAIIVYVREPSGAASSRLQQQAKAGLTVDRSPTRFVPDYRKNLAKYVELGRELENLTYEFVPYDRRQLTNNCVVRDFCRRVGIAIADEEVRNSNESLTRDATRLLCCRNLFLEKEGLERRTASEFVAVFNTVGGPKFRLSREIVLKGMAQHEEGIAWMESHLPEGWLSTIRPNDGSEIRSRNHLLAVPKEARRWLAERVAGYAGSADPLAIGAATERLVDSLWAELEEPRRAERAAAAEQRKAKRLAAAEERKAERLAVAAQRKVESLAAE